MEEVVIPIVIGIIQVVLSVNCIIRQKNEIAILSEILSSLVLLCIMQGLAINENDIYNKYIILVLGEYLAVKIFVVIFMITARIYCFHEIKRLCKTKKKMGRKKIKIIKKFNKVKYWPRLKLGLPSQAGKRNPKTKVRFNEKGFPIFKAYYTVKLRRKYFRETREKHFYMANKILYKHTLSNCRIRNKFTKAEIKILSQGETPKRYTWHHNEQAGVLQLVEHDIHSKTPHIGGYSIWGGK